MGIPLDNHFRILIVDDSRVTHQIFYKLLDLHSKENVMQSAPHQSENMKFPSFEIDSAYQGNEALQLVEDSIKHNKPYALAFVDIRMPPGWDGLETISR